MSRPENTASRETALRGIAIRASFPENIMDHLVEINGAALRVEIPTHIDLKQDLVFRDGDACAISFGVALASNPNVMLVTGPLSSLDPHLREEQYLRVQKGGREITPNAGDKCNLKFLHPFWYETLAED